MAISPAPQFPERAPTVYERNVAPPNSSFNVARRGPLRFEEGIESDTDIPNEFAVGANVPPVAIVHRKWPEETMRERAHLGSAAWIEAPTFLGEFAGGAGEPPQQYLQRNVGEGRKLRVNPVTVEG